jgi:hypothetical protein
MRFHVVGLSIRSEGAERRPLSHSGAYFALTVLVGVMVFMNTGSPSEPTL